MARVFVLVLAIGLVPLALGAILIQRASHADQRRTLEHALLSDAQSGSADLVAYFDRARAVALLTAANPVFADFYTLPRSQHAKTRAGARAFRRVNVALAYLQKLYPAALAEACFIDRAGFENARVVRGVPARRSVLSLNESIHPFFRPTLQPPGLVYQAAPYLSPDTHEWVISNSTVVTTSAGLHPAMSTSRSASRASAARLRASAGIISSSSTGQPVRSLWTQSAASCR